MKSMIIRSLPLIFLSIMGCIYIPSEPQYWKRHTILPKGDTIEQLTEQANNPNNDRATRARAVCTLFARHIRPGASAADVHRVLKDAAWLNDCQVECIRILNGRITIDRWDTAYYFKLFPTKQESSWAEWLIVLGLSGELADEDGLRFLKGEKIKGNPVIIEYSISFPNPWNEELHVERFYDHQVMGYDLE